MTFNNLLSESEHNSDDHYKKGKYRLMGMIKLDYRWNTKISIILGRAQPDVRNDTCSLK